MALLRSTLSFCDVGGRLIFLDIAADRYFMLNDRDADLVRLILDRAVEDWPDGALARMTELGLLALVPDKGRPIRPITNIPASHECPVDRRPIAPNSVAGALWRLVFVRRSLRRGRLNQLIGRQRTRQSALGEERPNRPLAIVLGDFVAARPLIPVKYNCLVDSLALCGFLGARGHPSTLVMGVRLAPFGAHAWVQWQDMVLNDDRERVEQFTPILYA